MGICPRCGSWVDEGEPYCPECMYDGSESGADPTGFSDDMINVNGSCYRRYLVEEALEEMGYDMYDFNEGMVDEEELEEILEDI
jgi:uncharacterized protein CbrC (UPF0167 family)